MDRQLVFLLLSVSLVVISYCYFTWRAILCEGQLPTKFLPVTLLATNQWHTVTGRRIQLLTESLVIAMHVLRSNRIFSALGLKDKVRA